MELIEIMESRHSVRQYTNKLIEEEKREILINKINEINNKNNLNFQIYFDEPNCFNSLLAHYGKFTGVQNYICLVGTKANDLEEKCGYYGEELVLLAQSIGLNTCWVAMTHGKSSATVKQKEKLVCLIALGYGKNQGYAHKTKTIDELSKIDGIAPNWFYEGMKAVQLAPTAMNQQKFLFEYKNHNVSAKVNGFGFYTKLDLGIVIYHFEAITGKKLLK